MSALTPARRRALEVLAATHPRPARVSNTTTKTAGVALIYWQSADWLTGQSPNLAQVVDSGLVLTAAGLQACRDASLAIRTES